MKRAVPGKEALPVIALAGNPNVGKSTVFNALTGLRQHTGNWPGKTVSIAVGDCRKHGRSFALVDLPGTYSLSSDSPEEEIAAEEICFGRHSGVVVVCDATCLERCLFLALQILAVTRRVVICVNMMDEASRRGIHPDLKKLEVTLGVPVIGVSAKNRKSLGPLLDSMDALAENKGCSPVTLPLWPEEIRSPLSPLAGLLHERFGSDRITPEWMAWSLVNGEEVTAQRLDRWCGEELSTDEEIQKICADAWDGLQSQGIQDIKALETRWSEHLLSLSEGIFADSVRLDHNGIRDPAQTVDRLLTGRWVGYPLMVLLLAVVFYLTIRGASLPSRLLSQALFRMGDMISRWLLSVGISPQLHNLLILGMYRMVVWVVSVMLPPMAIFFPLFTLLEDVGYLPRAAFNMDKPFQRCSACGKQALTMAMGFGCNAAGVVGCRIIRSPRERMIAILTNSLVPCNGRFPILIALLGLFFAGNPWTSALGLTGLVVLSIGATLWVSKLLSVTVLKGERSAFVLELPPFRMPNVGQVLVRSVLDRTLFVLGRAAAVAAPAGIVLWVLANIRPGGVPLLRTAAEALEPVGALMGLDGVILLAFILGFPANETVLPIALMIYTAQGNLGVSLPAEELGAILAENGWTWTTAGSVLLFTLFHWPCSTTLLTIRKETGRWDYTLLAALLPTVCGFAACVLFHGVTSLFT